VGTHDRESSLLLPDHISAKPEDLDRLMKGVLETNELLLAGGYPAVLQAAAVAFGFVFIHPFEDGNG
jgi:Fic family protein